MHEARQIIGELSNTQPTLPDPRVKVHYTHDSCSTDVWVVYNI